MRRRTLSPDLNEGLLLRTEWTGRAVMGMVEFLWGLSDGINDAGLCVALANGGSAETAPGFGVTTILRYILETCETVDEAVAVLRRVPSHMAYNIVLADRSGRTASVELAPGGGAKRMNRAIATNHQSSGPMPARALFTRTEARLAHLEQLSARPCDLADAFLVSPLRQDRYQQGFGTLFTCDYEPLRSRLTLIWPAEKSSQSLYGFVEGRWKVFLKTNSHRTELNTYDWADIAKVNWARGWSQWLLTY